MEDERNIQCPGGEAQEKDQVEVKDRGLFDHLLGKKKEEEKKQEEVLVTGIEKVTVTEPEKAEVKKEENEGEKKESLVAKLHRSSSSSSSSSDEEEEVIDEKGEVVKRKKKGGLKEKIKEKLPGHKDQEGEEKAAAQAVPAETHGGHHVAVEKVEGDINTEAPHAAEEEKKGFLDKIKEKLPGGHKKTEEAGTVPAALAPAPVAEEVSSPDGKEKKGILGKIMERLPGYNKGAGEEEKAAAAGHEHKTSD